MTTVAEAIGAASNVTGGQSGRPTTAEASLAALRKPRCLLAHLLRPAKRPTLGITPKERKVCGPPHSLTTTLQRGDAMAPAAGKSSSRKFTTVAQFQTEPMFKSERKFAVERGLWPPEPAATDATLDQLSLEEKPKDCIEKYGGFVLAIGMVCLISSWFHFLHEAPRVRLV